MLDLVDFVSRLKQVVAWSQQVSRKPVYLDEQATWTAINKYKQILQIALLERDAQILPTAFASTSFQEVGRILCLAIDDYADIWGFKDETSMPPIDTWFALDEYPQDCEAILYCWIPKSLERLTEQEVGPDFFWRDKRPNMFYNAVLLAMAKSV